MPLGTPHLTGETLRQGITYPGQAHFAIPGATRKCFDCYYWVPKRPSDRKAICLKAEQLLRNERPRAIPSYATICQHFTETAPSADE